MTNHKITKVEQNSIAHEMGVEPGDLLVAINETPVRDVFDYRYRIANYEITATIQKPCGEQWLLEIEKDEDEDLGLEFETGLMDEPKHCANKCIFCFIDQLPKNMRKTLYFKDDDARLSFLSGNYVTLSNISETELDRLISYRLSPINISVHSTDLGLRRQILGNPNSDNILNYIEKIKQAGLSMNFQIVLLKGINDGIALDETIENLSRLHPNGCSLSVVKVGLTKHRNNLYPLEPFTAEDSKTVLKQIDAWQQKFLKTLGTRFVYACDEFYISAEKPLPDCDFYESFPQIENGVGMLSLFTEQLEKTLATCTKALPKREVSVVTGEITHRHMQNLASKIQAKTGVMVHVHSITNNFFGKSITVTGLLTGQDIISQLKNKPLGSEVLICQTCLKADSNLFLDDTTVENIETALNTKVTIVENCGHAFLESVVGR